MTLDKTTRELVRVGSVLRGDGFAVIVTQIDVYPHWGKHITAEILTAPGFSWLVGRMTESPLSEYYGYEIVGAD